MIETVCNVCFILEKSKYITGKLYREFKLILTHLTRFKRSSNSYSPSLFSSLYYLDFSCVFSSSTWRVHMKAERLLHKMRKSLPRAAPAKKNIEPHPGAAKRRGG